VADSSQLLLTLVSAGTCYEHRTKYRFCIPKYTKYDWYWRKQFWWSYARKL